MQPSKMCKHKKLGQSLQQLQEKYWDDSSNFQIIHQKVDLLLAFSGIAFPSTNKHS